MPVRKKASGTWGILLKDHNKSPCRPLFYSLYLFFPFIALLKCVTIWHGHSVWATVAKKELRCVLGSRSSVSDGMGWRCIIKKRAKPSEYSAGVAFSHANASNRLGAWVMWGLADSELRHTLSTECKLMQEMFRAYRHWDVIVETPSQGPAHSPTLTELCVCYFGHLWKKKRWWEDLIIVDLNTKWAVILTKTVKKRLTLKSYFVACRTALWHFHDNEAHFPPKFALL